MHENVMDTSFDKVDLRQEAFMKCKTHVHFGFNGVCVVQIHRK